MEGAPLIVEAKNTSFKRHKSDGQNDAKILGMALKIMVSNMFICVNYRYYSNIFFEPYPNDSSDEN